MITRPPFAQNRCRFLRDCERPDEIDADDALEFVRRHLLNGAIADNPGIVYQDIEPAALILYLLHHRFDLLRLRHVALDYQRFIQFLRYSREHRLCFVPARRRGNSPRIVRRVSRNL